MTSIPFPTPALAALPHQPSPLSTAHLAQLEDATRRQKKIRRAVVVATSDAWLTAIFAGLTLATGFLSPISLLLGSALAGIAWNAFTGARLLKRLDDRAPARLAWNQLALAGILMAYAAYSLLTAGRNTQEIHSAIGMDPQLASMLGSIDKLMWMITLAVYAGLIVGTIFAQGLAAWYYASRAKHLRAYKQITPEWILQVQARA